MLSNRKRLAILGTGFLSPFLVATLLQTEKEEWVEQRKRTFSSGSSHFFLGPVLIFSCTQNYIYFGFRFPNLQCFFVTM